MSSLLRALLLCAFSLCSLAANSQQGSHVGGIPTRTPTPTKTAVTTADNNCCFCIYPDRGKRDSEKLERECNLCGKAFSKGCNLYRSMQQSELTPEKVQQLSCDSISIVNNQHGPNAAAALAQIKVCQAAFPGCPTKVNDLSCSTYSDDASAWAAIREIQRAIPLGATVELCGSTSDNFESGCSFQRISKRWVIAPSVVKEELGLCPGFGENCSMPSDGGKRFNCTDTLGRKVSIPCCSGRIQSTNDEGQRGAYGAAVGFWGDQNGCNGRGCDPARCPPAESCLDASRYKVQRCVGDLRTGFCQTYVSKCPPSSECRKKGNLSDKCWSIQTPVPTVTSRAS